MVEDITDEELKRANLIRFCNMNGDPADSALHAQDSVVGFVVSKPAIKLTLR